MPPTKTRTTNPKRDIDRAIRATVHDDGKIELPKPSLMWASFPYFMSQLVDEQATQLAVAEHHEEWCGLLVINPLVCLLAPRDHGKSYTVIAYLLWRAWRHNRSPLTGELIDGLPEGKLEVLYFSDTVTQVMERMQSLQSLALANEALFGDVLPDFARGKAATVRAAWSTRRVRLKNRFEIRTRAFRTSTRGAHPDVIVLDDVLNDTNTMTQYQRDKGWRYFQGTVMPMNAKQVIVIGTALHYDDLLHRLKPDKKKAPLVVHGRRVRFTWRKYRAVNWDTREVLWSERHTIDELEGIRDADALLFSREYQNDPRDDASSLFPTDMTEPAIAFGKLIPFAMPVIRPSSFFAAPPESWPRRYMKDPYEFVVLSGDMALSSNAAADYCVINVGSYNVKTQKRQLLWALRGRGWGFDEQVKAIRLACLLFPVDLGVMEHNTFQKWVHDETLKYPETAGRIVGHNTGPEKQQLQEGVPGLAISLAQGLWTIAAGDKDALRYARTWQMEMQAFGWKDGKLQGVGEHDDTVIAFWLLERAVRLINTFLRQGPPEQYIGMSDVGIKRVQLTGDWDNPVKLG
jgi:hypothetical protein